MVIQDSPATQPVVGYLSWEVIDLWRVSEASAQPHLHDEAPVKTLDTKTQVGFLVGDIPFTLSLSAAGNSWHCSQMQGERTLEPLSVDSHRLCPVSFLLDYLNLYPFLVINHNSITVVNHPVSCSSELSNLQVILDTLEVAVGVRSEGVLKDT